MVGAPGTVAGVTDGVTFAVAAAPSPTPLVAVTLIVYSVPLVSPVTVQLNVEASTVHPAPAGSPLEVTTVVTVKPVIALPPSSVGAAQATSAELSARVATTLVGIPGTVAARAGCGAETFAATRTTAARMLDSRLRKGRRT